MKRDFLHSLRARLFVLILAVLAPAGGIFAWSSLLQLKRADENYQRETLRLAELEARNFHQFIQEGRIVLTLLRSNPEVRRLGRRCDSVLAAVLAEHRRFDNLGVIGADGYVRCSALPVAGRVYLGDRSYFRSALATGKFAVGRFQVGRITRHPGFPLALPLTATADKAAAVLFATLDLNWLSRGIGGKHEIPGTVVSISDEAGRLLAQQPALSAPGEVVPAAAHLAARRGTSGSFTAPGWDGEPTFWSFYRLTAGDSSGLVWVSIPQAAAEAPVQSILRRDLALLATLLMLGLAVTWVLGGRLILRKTRALTAAAERLQAGDLGARSGLAPGRDELSRLGATFDAMAESLARRAEESRRQLEQIARLNRTYRLLTAINSLIIRAPETDTLFREACRIATEQGGLRLAWIGEVNRAAGVIRPLAWSGPPEFDPQRLHIALQPATAPAARAARDGQSVVSNDFLHDPATEHWHAIAERRGIGASASLPLAAGSEVRWVLNLYAREAGFFTGEEMALLEQLAADIALGVRTLTSEGDLRYLATHDPVTGLPNRTLLLEQLDYAMKRGRRSGRWIAAVAFEPLGFQRISDMRGARLGDALLRELGARLKSSLREGDLLGHDSGARLVAVLADVAQAADVRAVVARLLGSLHGTLRIGEDDIPLSLRAGIALFPGDAETPDELLQCALLALQEESGREPGALVFFSAELNRDLQENLRLERGLRRALEEQALELHYQPVVDIGSDRLAGFEALARWSSPEFGAVPPGRFIPLAEASGLILPLGEWALGAAARQAFAWERAGQRALRIAVNVSAAQLQQPDFAERVRHLLEAGGGVPRGVQLALEITESMLVRDLEETVQRLCALKKLGFALYLDDFGTGYSSLSYLHRLPFDVVKIDQSFIRRLSSDPASVAVVRSIIGIAAAFDAAVIAEGVETPAQLALLRELGCRLIQGYLFSKPLPAAEAERWFDYGRAK